MTEKPLLRRWGFWVPVLGVLALVGLAATWLAVARTDRALAARTARLDALRAHLDTPGAWGDDARAKRLAAAVAEIFGTFKHAEDRKQAAVAVDVIGTAPRRAIIVVRVPSLRRWGGRDRRRLLLQLANAVEPKLAGATQALIGVQGELSLGSIAVRTKQGEWVFKTDAPDAEHRLRDAFAVSGK